MMVISTKTNPRYLAKGKKVLYMILVVHYENVETNDTKEDIKSTF